MSIWRDARERSGAGVPGRADVARPAPAGHRRKLARIHLRDLARGHHGDAAELAADAQALVERIRRYTAQLPIALGFGISNSRHVRAVGAFADAAVVGSAVVQLIERTPPADAAKAVGEFVAGLRRFSE